MVTLGLYVQMVRIKWSDIPDIWDHWFYGLVSHYPRQIMYVEEEILFERFGVDYQAYADETAR
jgi:hypothetical protein